MKKVVLTLFTVGFFSNAFCQNVNIPDANFKDYLIYNDNINTNFDDEIQVSEAVAFNDSIICAGLQIQDLTGIEAFHNISFLSCVNNDLTSLDLSQNIALQSVICAMNDLSSLDVSANINLKDLRCSYNPIQSLDLGNNPNLKYLYCENNNLASLDVSQNSGLLELYCTSNSIASLDLSGHIQLIKLDCSSNPLTSLELAPNNALEYIMCNGNQLPSIALENCPALVHFRGVNNTYTQLDLSNCPNLKIFDCPFTQLTSLDFSQNPLLQTVYCFSSNLTSLNLANGNNPNLQLVWVNGNDLTCIQVDDVNYSATNWTTTNFSFDSGTYFSVDCIANVSDLITQSVQIYPNPTKNIISITINESASFKLISAQGELISDGQFKAGTHSFNLEAYPSGIYFFEFAAPGKAAAVQKISKL